MLDSLCQAGSLGALGGAPVLITWAGVDTIGHSSYPTPRSSKDELKRTLVCSILFQCING